MDQIKKLDETWSDISEARFTRNVEQVLNMNPKMQDDFDTEYLKQKLDLIQERLKKEDGMSFRDWVRGKNAITRLPGFMPKISRVQKVWQEEYGFLDEKPYKPSYYQDRHEDTHLYQFINSYIDVLTKLNIEACSTSMPVTTGVNVLLACGTGDGKLLKEIIERVQPISIVVIVTDWNDFISSFGEIDWNTIWEEYSKAGKSIRVTRVKTEEELLAEAQSKSLLSLEYSYVYVDPDSKIELQDYSKILHSDRIGHLIFYLGYTVDEYNMVLNTTRMLMKGPKVYLKTNNKLKGRAIVTASGPSLDKSIDTIREMSKDSIVIASASSVRTLLRKNIRVDIVVLIERGFDVFEAYSDLADEFDLSATTLFSSSTCDHNLNGLFGNHVCFFRSALTPLSIYSNTNREILPFDGPEAVNAALSIACELGIEYIDLFGVDLGSANKELNRSSDAVAFTNRQWDMEEKGNQVDIVYTNRAMIDVRHVLERTIRLNPSVSVKNWSNGLFIDGASPCSDDSQIAKVQINNIDDLSGYINSLPTYESSRVVSSWNAANLRRSSFKLFRSLDETFFKEKIWFHDILVDMDNKLGLSCALEDQVIRRIVRSIIYKVSLIITQHLYIAGMDGAEKMQTLLEESKDLLKILLRRLELEINIICDHIDNEISG